MKKIILIIMTLAFVSSGAYAYPVSYEISSDEAFSQYVVGCDDAKCSSLNESAPYTVRNDNEALSHSYQITGTGVLYTAEFDYVEGFLPHAYVTITEDAFSNGPHNEDIEFKKKDDCSAEIRSIKFDDEDPEEGDEVDIEIRVKSAFTRGGIPADLAIPDFLRDHYSSRVEVNVEIIDEDGFTVDEFEKRVEIFMDTVEKIEFEWDTDSAGRYEVEVRTEVIDDVCEDSDDDTDSERITVDEDFRRAEIEEARARTVSTSSITPGFTDFSIIGSRDHVSPGDSMFANLVLENGENRRRDFTIFMQRKDGFSAQSMKVSVPAKGTVNFDYPINVNDAAPGDHVISINVDAGSRMTKEFVTTVTWDMIIQTFHRQENGKIIMDYNITNEEPYSTEVDIVLRDGIVLREETVSLTPSSTTSGSFEYDSTYSGMHMSKIEVSKAGQVVTTAESEFEAQKQGSMTGYFVAGGSMIGGIVALFLILLFFVIYERNKSGPKDTAKRPLLESNVPVKDNYAVQERSYYDSIFSSDKY